MAHGTGNSTGVFGTIPGKPFPDPCPRLPKGKKALNHMAKRTWLAVHIGLEHGLHLFVQ